LFGEWEIMLKNLANDIYYINFLRGLNLANLTAIFDKYKWPTHYFTIFYYMTTDWH